MYKHRKSALSLMAIGLLVVQLSACEKTDVASDEKGPAEKVGQQLDQAASRAGEEINKAAEKAGKGLQELGQKLQNEAQQERQGQKQKNE